MNRFFSTLAVCIIWATTAQAHEYEHEHASAPTQEIVRAGSQASIIGSPDYFIGRVNVTPLFPANEHNSATGAYVSFEPGARSAWHIHPAGQRLVVISGTGLTQEWGKPIQVIQTGDVVLCPPGVKHWHGAAPTIAMTHLAVTNSIDGKSVIWMEKVSDDQYNSH
ncbi:cupin domain-containing protein [Undibacterium sp. CY18W]|uniref:Cupin domain-containing protein n=1 Tax=Undibacterium hunanense TaxID=2762292 RepID=A0ABR6ZU87_9BURK|nr:cupin domain-containing protein [Undibacterium hunanense]MBC3919444.1 cupin domain-containing protein [Undibacterium hunanense]